MGQTRDLLVVKYGSSSVTNGVGMDEERVERYAGQLAELRREYDLILVSSGSVAVGRALWKSALVTNGYSPSEQTLATIGSGRAFTVWQDALRAHGILAGQLLVTHHEIDDPEEGSMLQRVMRDNLTAGIVSLVNENDALNDEEIRVMSYGGDNDWLAAHIAIALGASKLCLLTDTEGLLDKQGAVVTVVSPRSREHVKELLQKPNNLGRGGMESKVGAAQKAADKGVTTYIGHADAPLEEILDGKRGTHFPPALAQNIVE